MKTTISALLLVFVMPVLAPADVAVFSQTDHGMIFNQAVNGNAGAAALDYTFENIGTGHVYYAFVNFDFSLPAGVTINSAYFDVYSDAMSAPALLSVQALRKSWNGGVTSDFNPAQDGELTWNSARHNQVPWETPGALGASDVYPTVDPSVLVPVVTGGDYVQYDVTNSLTTLYNDGVFEGWVFRYDVAGSPGSVGVNYNWQAPDNWLIVDYTLLICDPELTADISGPAGVKDCYVDLYDFAVLAAKWLDVVP